MTEQWTRDRGRQAASDVLTDTADLLAEDPDLSINAAIAVQSVVQHARVAVQLERIAAALEALVD